MRRKILIVNANKGMCFLLQTLLSPAYNLIIVANVFEGIKELRRNKNIEVFIVDADTNTDECIEFISHVQGSWLYHCPGIVLTKDSELAAYFTTVAAECTVFPKPFNPSAILDSISSMVSPAPILA